VYEDLLKTNPGLPKAADVMFTIASAQQELKLTSDAKKTLKRLVTLYPGSEPASKAQKLLNTKK